ncbi:Pplasmid pRiA4b ORF-3-like protein [Candidatus Vecturithrix granuli]|uniref:Pplasmid pRiA4b ORF-3-like protein n=1 Tax=Vecturithrix granuli TaxID=1499967 RepID=A0A081C8A6_VECG1|nr:Pplasmid pRiA4b ORF-3-like protein [Candidatus Vecturithrix granuli]
MIKKSTQTRQPGLTPEQQNFLRKQVIDEQPPGAILHDFEVLLAFLQAEAPFKVTGQNNLIPLTYLRELNERFSHPIRLDLKRPQFKSFPNIAGVYLLLRASGLTYLSGSEKMLRLEVDEEAVASWHDLNPTERYFNLLETWAFRARPEILGEQRSGLFGDPLYTWRDLFQKIPGQEMIVAANKEHEDTLKFWVGYYMLPLLAMLGFLRIEDGAPEPGKGWNVLSVKKTPFGEAMLAIFAQKLPEWDDYIDVVEEQQREAKFGVLQPLFQPYFPEWQHNLVIPEPADQEGTYIFKVILWGKIWRRIAIPGAMVLDKLATVILNAFRFDFDHLYRFIFKNRFGLEQHVNHPMLEESPFTDEVKVQDLPLQPGMSMIFFYDFGDNWEFVVPLEQVTPPDPTLRKAKVLEEHGKSPDQYRW